MNTYAVAITLRSQNLRHTVCVIVRALSPDEAVNLAETKALGAVKDDEDHHWEVEDCWLFDQHVIDMEYHG